MDLFFTITGILMFLACIAEMTSYKVEKINLIFSIMLCSISIMGIFYLHSVDYTMKETYFISNKIKRIKFANPMKITVKSYSKPFCLFSKNDEYYCSPLKNIDN